LTSGCVKSEAQAQTHLSEVAANALPAATVTYYAGTAQLLNLRSGQTTQEKDIIARTVDPSAGTIVELLCGSAPNRPTFNSPVYMQVQGTSVRMSDTPDMDHPQVLRGTGTVAGPAWNWNYLTFNMTYATPQGSFTIIDANFVLPDESIVARKQIYDASGAPLELFDETVTKIDDATYQAAFAAMNCPTN
jgi:hypothetical protein